MKGPINLHSYLSLDLKMVQQEVRICFSSQILLYYFIVVASFEHFIIYLEGTGNKGTN